MRFAIDMDGVVSNFHASLIDVANVIWPGRFPKSFVPDSWLYEGHLTELELNQVMSAIHHVPYFWENQTPLPGMEELRAGLLPKDEAVFITARADTKGEPATVQTAKWLHYRQLWPRGGYSSVIRVEDPAHKKDLFRALKLTNFLDDYAPTVEELNQIEGVQAFVFDQPWNRHATELPRVSSVTEYLAKIRAV